MPLDKSGSDESVGKNIKAEIDAGRPRKQAVAIALSVQRKAKGLPERKKRGRISGMKMNY